MGSKNEQRLQRDSSFCLENVMHGEKINKFK
jgi:hypothetical protein